MPSPGSGAFTGSGIPSRGASTVLENRWSMVTFVPFGEAGAPLSDNCAMQRPIIASILLAGLPQTGYSVDIAETFLSGVQLQ